MVEYFLVAGIEREMSESFSIGLKAHWKRFEGVRVRRYAGALLRSHPPSRRLDGSEPVSVWSRSGDTRRFSALFAVRYAIP